MKIPVRHLRLGIAVVISSAFAGIQGLAATKDFGPSADTCIVSSAPANNFGASPSLILGGIAKAGERGRVLMQFDLTSIPAQAVVTNVTLKFPVLKQNSSQPPVPVRVHRMRTVWSEGTGTSGAGLQDTGSIDDSEGANWATFGPPTALWEGGPGAGQGVDYVGTMSGTGTLGEVGTVVISSNDKMIADVQSWVDQPHLNVGWILINGLEGDLKTARRIGSRENADAKPVLTVGYSVSTVAAGPRLAARISDGQFAMRFSTEPGKQYLVEASSDGRLPWQTVTNLPAQVEEVVFLSPLDFPNRLFRVVVK